LLPLPPKFCQPFERYRLLLANAIGYGLRFNPALLEQADFARCAIASVSGSAKRQSEYLAGRLCAGQAQYQLIGDSRAPSRDNSGMPLWVPGVTGSITHSHGRAAAVVALKECWRGLGVDLEPCLPIERALRLAPSILTAAERESLAALKSSQELRCV